MPQVRRSWVVMPILVDVTPMQVLDNMRRTLFMRTFKKHKEDSERELEERKNRVRRPLTIAISHVPCTSYKGRMCRVSPRTAAGTCVRCA